MALTRERVDDTRARTARDSSFPESLLRQGVDTLLAGDVGTGLSILRAYINARSASSRSPAPPACRPKACSACSVRWAIHGRATCFMFCIICSGRQGLDCG